MFVRNQGCCNWLRIVPVNKLADQADQSVPATDFAEFLVHWRRGGNDSKEFPLVWVGV